MTVRGIMAGFGVVVALVACGDDSAPRGADAEVSDTTGGPEVDIGSETFEVVPDVSDGPEVDVADDVPQDASVDAPPVDSEPLPGFGAISGACQVLDDELTAEGPSLFVNRIDFGDDPYDASDIDRLTDGGRKILADGNAGGSSILSEVFAFELLARCEGATLLKTEREIVYDEEAKITDMIVMIDGLRIGANPTRAIGFPFDAPYTVEQARTVLEKKLNDINSSSATVSAEDAWEKQILTVFAYGEGHVGAVEAAWDAIDPALKADTIVFVTVTDGSDRFIYTDE